MVKIADLPERIRLRKRLLDPRQVIGVHVITIEHEKFRVSALEVIVSTRRDRVIHAFE
jgi:hypothetical protein